MVRISAKHRKAIELKYLGKKYSYISKQVGLSETTLYKYFSKEGMLFDEYKEYAKDMSEVATMETRARLVSEAMEAVRTIIAISKGKDTRMSLRAAQDILDRAGITKDQSNLVNTKDDSEDYPEALIRHYKMGLEAGKKRYANTK